MVEKYGRGILTHRDRRYLAGELEVKGSHERKIRAEIRERLSNGLHDLGLIWDKLEDKDREMAFETGHQAALQAAVAIIFRETLRLPDRERSIENAIRNGIVSAAHEADLFVDLSLEIETRDFDKEKLLNKAQNGDASFDEVTQLVRYNPNIEFNVQEKDTE